MATSNFNNELNEMISALIQDADQKFENEIGKLANETREATEQEKWQELHSTIPHLTF